MVKMLDYKNGEELKKSTKFEQDLFQAAKVWSADDILKTLYRFLQWEMSAKQNAHLLIEEIKSLQLKSLKV